MHPEAYALVTKFAGEHVLDPATRVAEIGAYDVNGTFRPIFAHCSYTGLDMEAGPNVDRVIEPYYFGDELFDVVISGNTIEHVEDMAKWATACIAITKPGGMLCIVGPHGTSGFTEHRHPVDCWRIWPDGMRWLFRELEILECRTDARDTVMVGRKKAT
jgi:SAM-dependent methyltransferase